MSLFKNMTNSSYGTVPGNGHPKADDKIMNAGAGHVVPGENVHIAKRLIADMGYDPEAKVDMNQGKGSGMDVRISSKEMFLNQDQVKELNDKGVNPEMLSPNSQYNKTGNNMNTGGPKAYASGGEMGLYELMMNNSNQYSPAYQEGGPGDPPVAGSWDPSYDTDPNKKMQFNDFITQRALGKKYSDVPLNEQGIHSMDANIAAEYEKFKAGQLSMAPPSAPADFSGVGKLATKPLTQVSKDLEAPASQVQSMEPLIDNQIIDGTGNPSTTPQTMFEQNFNGDNVPDYLQPGNPNSMGENNQAQPIVTNPAAPSNVPTGSSPEEQHLDYLLDKNKSSANKEVAANLAMLGYNMSRERQPGEAPAMINMREMVRDYEGMKGKATADLERGERRNAYILKNIGAPDKIVGLHANTVAGTNQITQSIFDMQGQDSMQNISVANQAKADYENAMRQFRMNEAVASQSFKDAKGANMAENAAQIFDVRENELNNEATLKGYKVNQDMNELDRQYNTLNKSAIGNSNYFSRQDWYKMTPEEREKWNKISNEKTKPKVTN